jgi:TolB-like protein
MEVLVCLASQPGQPLSKEVILKTVWPDTFVTEDVLTRSISELRRTFQDDPRESRIIQTISKRGYRLIAAVERERPRELTSTLNGGAQDQTSPGNPRRNRRIGIVLGLLAAALVIAVLIARPKVSHWFSGSADFPQVRSIAILPLKNLSRDPGEQYLADGITDELITNLSQIRSLTVISRTSSATYVDTRKPLSQIARELSVDAVVQGTVIRSHGRIRVTAELIQTVPERHLWAGSFESALQDVVTQQRGLARNIAVAVAAQLTPQESQRLARATPVNPEAYRDYLLGEYYLWNRLSPEGRKQAMQYLERAVAEDPSYAPSHASLAQAYFRLAPMLNNSKPNALFERSRAAAFRAVELDDSLPDAHRIMGVIHFVSWNLAAAGKEFERSLELQPGDARNLHFHAVFLDVEGHHEEAISEARRAVALDPLNISVQSALGKIYTSAGRYDEAIAELNRVLAMDPGNTEIRALVGRAYELKGNYPRAIEELQKSRSDALQSSESVAYLGYIFAKEGKLAQAAACLEDLRRMSGNSSSDVSPVDFAIVYAGMGDTGKSVAWLQRGYRQHSQSVLDIALMPELASLRNDSRFQDLVRRINLPSG